MTIDATGGRVGAIRPARSGRSQGVAKGRRRAGVVLVTLAVVGALVALVHSATTDVVALASNPAPAPAPSNPHRTIAAQVLADPQKFVALERMGKEQLDAILKDPDSARYKDVVAAAPPAAKGSVTFCGLVNAKSSFGGYTGYTRFIAAPNVGAWLRNSPGIKFRQVWRDICQDRYVISKAEFVN